MAVWGTPFFDDLFNLLRDGILQVKTEKKEQSEENNRHECVSLCVSVCVTGWG